MTKFNQALQTEMLLKLKTAMILIQRFRNTIENKQPTQQSVQHYTAPFKASVVAELQHKRMATLEITPMEQCSTTERYNLNTVQLNNEN